VHAKKTLVEGALAMDLVLSWKQKIAYSMMVAYYMNPLS
jgi:hypothetical protein